MDAGYRFGCCELSLVRRELRINEDPVHLQPKVFSVLKLLVSNAGVALNRDQFLECIWSGRFVTEHVLARCILRLRQVLGDDAADPQYIKTVRGHGYQFIAPVTPLKTSENPAMATRVIAVLPFNPLIESDTVSPLALGLAETLINDLSRTSVMVVRPLSVVRNAQVNPISRDSLELGKNLGVDVVVDGTLQENNGRVRVSFRALRVADGSTVVSSRIDASLDDLLNVQDQLSAQIKQTLTHELSSSDIERSVRRRAASVPAFQAYIDGQMQLAKHSVEGAQAAIATFEQALELDPNYAEALVSLADAHEQRATLGEDHEYQYQQMRILAERAQTLDPGLARAYRCLGTLAWQHEWDWELSYHLLNKATQIDPGDAENLVALSDFLSYQRRYDEALDAIERAGEVNPFSPWVHALIIQALYMGGHIEDALAQGRRAVALQPDFSFSRFFLGLALLAAGQQRDAVDQIQRAVELSGRKDFVAVLGFAHARAGNHKAAAAIEVQYKSAQAQGVNIPPIAWAMLNMGFGRVDRALDNFSEVFRQRSWHFLLLHADPIFADLRNHPRAQMMIRQAGLNQ